MMRRAMLALALAAGACAAPQKTYRDLDRLGQDYQRQAAAEAGESEQARYQRWLDEARAQSRTAAPAQDTCAMSRFQHLIGAAADSIDRAALPPRTRIITPDMAVTQDYSPERLNIMVGSEGRVSSLRCF